MSSVWKDLEERIASALHLTHRPVAVGFLDVAPAGVEKFSGTEASGCSFWRLAAAGRTFYTVPQDHFNCAVGAYTHNIPLSPEREKETGQTLQLMFDAGYIRPEDVPQMPRLTKTPAVVVYAPLGEAPVDPDVVLFACQASAAMLLNEAAMRAGKSASMPALSRPTCMALPASLEHGAVLSLGCIGNRVYTGVAEDELYFVVRGSDLAAVADAMSVITRANDVLRDYAQARRRQLSTA